MDASEGKDPLLFPLEPRPLTIPFAHYFETYQPGELHGVPCSLQGYLQIPRFHGGQYKLVEGLPTRDSDMEGLSRDHISLRGTAIQNVSALPCAQE